MSFVTVFSRVKITLESTGAGAEGWRVMSPSHAVTLFLQAWQVERPDRRRVSERPPLLNGADLLHLLDLLHLWCRTFRHSLRYLSKSSDGASGRLSCCAHVGCRLR